MATRKQSKEGLVVLKQRPVELRARAVMAEEFRLVDGAGRTRALRDGRASAEVYWT